jgi:pimeloyl-ACP methyl ester carboxylesterase
VSFAHRPGSELGWIRFRPILLFTFIHLIVVDEQRGGRRKNAHPYESRQIENIVAWKSAFPNPFGELIRRAPRPLARLIAYDAMGALPGVTVPALVIVGDEDMTTLPEAGEFTSSHVPGAITVTLTPAKHMTLVEHHARFDRLIAEFVTNCLTVITVR